MRYFFRKSYHASLVLCFLGAYVSAAYVDPTVLDACPGYIASNVEVRQDGLTADLVLGGNPCNVFGNDIQKLSLSVVYETVERIHVKITDPSTPRYEVPESVFTRPDSDPTVVTQWAEIQFNYTTSPFSFSIYRSSTKEVLFSTASHPLIFEPQYLRVKTRLPTNANIYGLGEHTNPFRLPTDNTTLTLWSRDAYGIPTGTNLYGNHPVYFEHRVSGTHGVLLLSSNGMDIKLNNSDPGGPSLEYNVIGGIIDFYFLAGSETDPTEVARQYAALVGSPAEVPYWSFGFHQCRFGYKNFIDVANVVSKYAAAGIPLETMWTDIDYMQGRRIFTVDPNYFPLARMREIVSYLHSHDQKYIMMIDPAVAYAPSEGYAAYDRGKAMDVWLKASNGSDSLGVVWPGVTVYPDWFNPEADNYWTSEFADFFNPDTGIDIDGSWIDMNEPSSFCVFPCDDPFQQAREQNLPPPRSDSPPNANTPIFLNPTSQPNKRDGGLNPHNLHLKRGPYDFVNSRASSLLSKREDLQSPLYAINNAAGPLSSRTAYTDSKHANGLLEYDTHNLYGTMMSTATHNAMLARRPGKRTFVITRSTFVGAGRHVGKWLGDNFSLWDHYRLSIAGMLGFASIYQVPMIGSDICGFGENTTEHLCARWATLGSFYPFMRNHNSDTSISQEFYVWASVTEAAKYSLDIRYRLLDYIYTAFHRAHLDGSPVLHPLWFKYPRDENTFTLEYQFFFGDSILVSPVTEDDATSVSIYLPKDIFYDFDTLCAVEGAGSLVTLSDIPFTKIPLHIKGGAILPLRAQSAMTTTALRKKDFEFIVAPDTQGEASGTLYLDDGESITPASFTDVNLRFKDGKLKMWGVFGYAPCVNISRVRFLGVGKQPNVVLIDGEYVLESGYSYNPSSKILDVVIDVPFVKDLSVQYF